MFDTIRKALSIKDLRNKILFTIFIIFVVRLGSLIPIPGVDPKFFSEFFGDNDAFIPFSAITGGSFDDMAIFALGITPYITSSIIMQLLTIAIPKLEEWQRDGEEGRKKIVQITRYVTVALALIESTAMAIGFGRKGLLVNYTWYNVLVLIAILTAGSALLMWLGERITERGIGNGISIILMVNIISRLPHDLRSLWDVFISGKKPAYGILAAIIIIAIILVIVGLTVLLQVAERRIPAQYAKKMQGRRMVGGQASNIPLKVNTAGVIPVIFASSLMSFPLIIAQFFTPDYNTVGGKILQMLNSSTWVNTSYPWYCNIGFVVYILLIIAFAYFYTSITFNPLEVADNMKKQGGFIPGIRPGKSTSDYLSKILKYIIFIGAVGLVIVAIIPIIFSGIFGISRVSFAGTSLIIIVGVILETIKQIESLMLVRNYKGFLND